MIMHEDPADAEVTAYDGYAMDLLRRIIRQGSLRAEDLGNLVEDYCNQLHPDNWALTNIELTFRNLEYMEKSNEP